MTDDLARQNELCAATGGRVYRGAISETWAERFAREERQRLLNLERRLALANIAAGFRDATKQRAMPSKEHPSDLQAEYDRSSIRQMADARGITSTAMHHRLQRAGVTFKPQGFQPKDRPDACTP